MPSLTRQYRFAASHRLHSHQLSEEDNRRVYGKCNNPYGHGHDYIVQLRVSGPIDEDTGLILPVGQLDLLFEETIARHMANRHLNDLQAFSEQSPTTENLALEIERQVHAAWERYVTWRGPRFEGVRVLETKRNFIQTREWQ